MKYWYFKKGWSKAHIVDARSQKDTFRALCSIGFHTDEGDTMKSISKTIPPNACQKCLTKLGEVKK